VQVSVVEVVGRAGLVSLVRVKPLKVAGQDAAATPTLSVSVYAMLNEP
jgi:hypothetical protein